MRICFVGDSFVNGTSDPECLGWAGRICATARQQGVDLTYYNLGVRRDTTVDIKHRWQQEVACRLPDDVDGRIVFSFGVNDTTIEQGRPRVTMEESIENAHTILTTAYRHFPVLMVGPPPIANEPQNQAIAYLSTQFAALCQSLNIPYLDAFTPLHGSAVWMKEVKTGDGAHPGASGYAELAQLVQRWSGWSGWLKT